MKAKPECIEGPEASARFDTLVRKVPAVPHEEIVRRDAEYKRESALNPNKRGPKPKIRACLSLDREEAAR